MGMNRSGGGSGPAYQAGVGLLEVLIAVLVLAVGMLGMAALQAVTLKNSNGSVERSQAVIQSYSLFDTLRLNKTAALSGAYNVTGYVCAEQAPADGDATHDYGVFNGWLAGLQRDLGSSACGRLDCSGATCTVGVKWNDRASAPDSTLQMETTTRL